MGKKKLLTWMLSLCLLAGFVGSAVTVMGNPSYPIARTMFGNKQTTGIFKLSNESWFDKGYPAGATYKKVKKGRYIRRCMVFIYQGQYSGADDYSDFYTKGAARMVTGETIRATAVCGNNPFKSQTFDYSWVTCK